MDVVCIIKYEEKIFELIFLVFYLFFVGVFWFYRERGRDNGCLLYMVRIYLNFFINDFKFWFEN